jgi:hypothetical protein
LVSGTSVSAVIARNVMRFYVTFFVVTAGSIVLLLGGFDALAMSGMGEQLVRLVAFLAPASLFSALTALAIRGRPARATRVLIGVLAAAAAYAAMAATLVSTARGAEDYPLLLSPLYFVNMTAILAGLLFGALAEARPASVSALQR